MRPGQWQKIGSRLRDLQAFAFIFAHNSAEFPVSLALKENPLLATVGL